MIRFDPSELRQRYNHYSRHEYETLLLQIVGHIQEALATSELRFQIKHRVKDFEEYLNKLSIKNDGKPKIDRIEDLMGIRIVCPFLEDLEEAQRILSARFDITEIDKKNPKPIFS